MSARHSRRDDADLDRDRPRRRKGRAKKSGGLGWIIGIIAGVLVLAGGLMVFLVIRSESSKTGDGGKFADGSKFPFAGARARYPDTAEGLKRQLEELMASRSDELYAHVLLPDPDAWFAANFSPEDAKARAADFKKGDRGKKSLEAVFAQASAWGVTIKTCQPIWLNHPMFKAGRLAAYEVHFRPGPGGWTQTCSPFVYVDGSFRYIKTGG